MGTQVKLSDIADELLIVNKHTIDALFRLDNAADCIALYIFYYKTAKWQQTDTIKASDDYVKKSLKWGIDKIHRTKESLKESGLIDVIQRREDGKIVGWYIKVSYMVSQRSFEDVKIVIENNSTQHSKNTQKPQVVKATSGFQETNALREYSKCLKNDTGEMLKDNKREYVDLCKKEITKERTKKFEDEFEVLWKQYPRKEGKKEARTAYIGARKKRTTVEEVQEGLQRYLDKIQREHTEYRFIKKGSSWFRGYCWEDVYTSDNTGGRFKTGRRPITELDPNNAWDAAELKQRLAEGEQLPKGASL